jgi:hypothetical protein
VFFLQFLDGGFVVSPLLLKLDLSIAKFALVPSNGLIFLRDGCYLGFNQVFLCLFSID